MRTRATLLALLLGACAITPNELRVSGQPVGYTRMLPPEKLAECYLNRLRNAHGEMTAYRENAGSRIDVVGRMENWGAVVIYEISALDGGARVFLYLHPQMFMNNRPKAVAEFQNAC